MSLLGPMAMPVSEFPGGLMLCWAPWPASGSWQEELLEGGADGTTELRQHPVEGGEGCKCPSCMVSKVSFWLILEEVITEGLGPVTLYISCAWDKHGILWFWTLALPGL